MKAMIVPFFVVAISGTTTIVVFYLYNTFARMPAYVGIRSRGQRRPCRRFAFVFVGLLHSTGASMAESDAPLPTRWIHPQDQSPPVYEQPVTVLKKHIQVLDIPSIVEDLSWPDPWKGRIALVVEMDLYSAIETKLNHHMQFLQQDGYDVIPILFSGTPTQLRTLLIEQYNEPSGLTGAILIGNLPYVIFEMSTDWFGEGPELETFACDLYFMDMDGIWEDTNGSSRLDSWTGNREIEIWVARWKTDNMQGLGTSRAVVNHYLEKNHAYRIGWVRPAPRSLVYTDNDWSEDWGPIDSNHLAHVYGADYVTLVNDDHGTTVADYLNHRLPVSQEFIHTRSHGWPQGHGYYTGSYEWEWLWQVEYRDRLPPALFYSLFVCSGADYLTNDNLASTIVFNHEFTGLFAIGSTKTGGMWWEDEYYESLAQGNSFGKAFVDWFNAVYTHEEGAQWWYGMVLIGDASLRPSPLMPAQVTTSANHRFYRIRSAHDATILELGADGFLVWENGQLGGTGQVETATTLKDGGDWFVIREFTATNTIMSARVVIPFSR